MPGVSARAACLVACVSILSVAGSAAFASELDDTFSRNGKLRTSLLGGNDVGVVVRPSGEIVVAASKSLSDIALLQLQPNGSVDTDFGTDGAALAGFSSAESRDVALQSDGKVVVVGCSDCYSESSSFAVARFLPSGSLDPAFSGDGRRTTNFGRASLDSAEGVAVADDGAIVAVGLTSFGSTSTFSMARYLPNGQLDSAFGNGGKVMTSLGSGYAQAFATAIQDNGKIVVVGHSDGAGFVVARYTATGLLDPAFGRDGVVTAGFGDQSSGNGVAIQRDGNIVAVGSAEGRGVDFALVRLHRDGSRDDAFGSHGRVTTNFGRFDAALDVALGSNGIVAVGSGRRPGAQDQDFAVAVYGRHGRLNSQFSGDGQALTRFTHDYDEATSVAMQPNGRIVVAGRARGSSEVAVARYLPG